MSLSLTTVISLLLCLLYYSAFDNNTSGITESKYFAEAESLYLQNEYPSALQQYRNFQENFPESILLPLTSLRIASLNSALDSLQQQKHHFDNQTTNLLEKATVLAMNKQYLSPPGNNALAYLDKLNQLDPDNMEAKQLRKKIFTIYQNDAQLAYKKRDYQQAKGLYSAMLTISPTDVEVHKQLHNLEILLNQEPLNRKTGGSATRSPSRDAVASKRSAASTDRRTLPRPAKQPAETVKKQANRKTDPLPVPQTATAKS
ncbi:MAG: hypothetical protein AAFP70_21150, partial [Calditrichota bacterium]